MIRLVILLVGLAGIDAAVERPALLAQQATDESEHQLQIRARQRLIAHQKRVDLVAEKLIDALPAGVRPDSARYIGLRVADHKAKENKLLAEALGASAPKHPFVYSVDPTSPADDAGMEPGDQIVTVAGEPVKDAKKFHKLISRSDLQFPLRVRALRGDEIREFEIRESYRPRGLDVLVHGDGKNVYSFVNEREIVISTGMLNFLENDSELAVILGHEMAHVVRRHFSTSYRTAGFQPYFSQDLEKEADRYGLEFAYRAGYDPEVGVDVWERFDVELPRDTDAQWLLSHPTNRQRIASVRKIAEELKARPPADQQPEGG